MLLDEGDQIGRSHFLLALGEYDDVHRQRPAGAEVGLQRLDVQEELSLVIGGAAGVDPPVADLGFEGGRVPEVQRLRGLHVVVPVDEDGGCVRPGPTPLAHYHRVPRRGEGQRLQPSGLQLPAYPLGRPLGVGVVLRLGRDGRDAQEVPEFRVKPVTLPAREVDGVAHCVRGDGVGALSTPRKGAPKRPGRMHRRSNAGGILSTGR